MNQMGLDETEETNVAASVIVFPALVTEWFKNIIAILNPCAEAWRQLNNTFPGQGDDLPCL